MEKDNTNFVERQDFIDFKPIHSFISRLAKNVGIFEENFDDGETNAPLLKDPTGAGFVENCPFRVPKAYAENPEAQPRERKHQNVDPEEKYKAYASEMHNGKITDNCIKSAVRIWKNSQTVLMTRSEKGIVAFEGNAKGSKKYAQDQRTRIRLHAEEAHLFKPAFYFLTLTQRVQPGKDDILVQYNLFKESTSKFLDLLVKTFSCSYEIVFESTANGYCHAHLVAHFENYFNGDIGRKHKHSTEIVGGFFRNWIKSHWSLGMSKLETSKVRSPIFYLLKYISKSSYANFTELAKEERPLNKEERKMLLTIFNSIVARKRFWQGSQFTKEQDARFLSHLEKLQKEEEEKAKQSASENVSKCYRKYDVSFISERITAKAVRKTAVGGSAHHREAVGLDWASINFEMPCYTALKALNYVKFKSRSFGEIEDFSENSVEMQKIVYDSGVPLKCAGCVLSHIANEMKFGNDEWFHKDGFNNQFAEERDFWLYNEDERAEREELLQKYDERLLPFVAENLNVTFFKKRIQPAVKISHGTRFNEYEREFRPYEKGYESRVVRRINRYLADKEKIKTDDFATTGRLFK